MFAHSRLHFVAAVFIFLLMTSLVAAQEETLTEVTPEVTEEPVLVVEPTPVPEITEEPTAAPTDEPTAVPTDEATAVPTEITPEVTEEAEQGSETPAPEETATDEPDVPTPDVVSAPPVFEIATSLSAEAGQPLSILFAIYDEQGAAVITQIVSAAGAQTTLEIAAPIQTSPPFATTGTITYIAAETFIGLDTLTITAVDGAGISASTTIQIDVQPVVEVTEEATAEATQEATEEATAEATPEATPEATAEVTPEATPEVSSTERIINYDPQASEEAIQAMLAALNATEISRIPQLGAMKVLISQELASSSSAMAALQGNQAAVMAGMTALEENIIYQLDAQPGVFNPNDPQFRNGNQWALLNGVGGINAQDAWTRAKKDGAGVLVAVLDTGVDIQHPDLARQLDLTRAWDFINDDKTPDDDHNPPSGAGGHGTHVAGIIAAKTNNSLFMAGVAYKAKIIPVKVCAASTGCPAYEIAQGIVHAVDKGARIINLSLGGPGSATTLQGAVQYALSRNVIVIAAAGNSGNSTPHYPASYPGVISVAAHNIDGNIWSGSTQNNTVTVSAPGVNVYSLARVDWPGGTGDAFWTGTSSSAAYVSGIAALLYADNVARTPAAVREALICSAEDAGAPGYDNAFGYGRVQADVALTWRGPNAGCHIPIPNDLFAGAMVIKKVPFTVSQVIHSRNVTTDATDPTDCGTPVQTLWYKFIPPASRRYQITSFGSSHSTKLAVYQGIPGKFVRQDNCAIQMAFNGDSFISLDMKKGQVYYIVLSTSGSPVNNQSAFLDIRPTLTANGSYDDNNPAFSYRGTWTRITAPNRSKAMQTDSNGSIAAFTFQGTSFDLYRVVGPDQGAMEVWINGQRYDFDSGAGGIQNLDNRAPVAAVEARNITIPFAFHGEQQTIIIRRAETGPSGPVAIDRIHIYNTPLKAFSGKIDDRDPRLEFGGGFWGTNVPANPLMFKGGATRTRRAGAALRAVVKGSTIIIYRNIGPNHNDPNAGVAEFGSMEIYVDGVLWGTVNNNHPTHQYSVPIVISNLTPTTHMLRILNPEAKELQIDAIEGTNKATFPVNSIARPNDKRAARSGLWGTPVVLAKGVTAHIATAPTARLDFNFSGNAFCVAFMRRDDGGTMHVYVDDMTTPHARVSTHTNPNQWAGHFWPPDMLTNTTGVQQYCTGAAFAEGVHHVRLTFPNGSGVWLTQLQFGRFGVLTSNLGVVQENDKRLPTTETLYNTPVQTREMAALWKRIKVKFAGGAKALGGYLKRAVPTTNPSPDPVIRFYMHGSGFIIYTTRGPNAGVMQVRICRATSTEDCVPAQFLVNGSNLNGNIDLFSADGERPFAYAITGLEPGIYLIKIYATGTANEYVDFDGVRVLP